MIGPQRSEEPVIMGAVFEVRAAPERSGGDVMTGPAARRAGAATVTGVTRA